MRSANDWRSASAEERQHEKERHEPARPDLGNPNQRTGRDPRERHRHHVGDRHEPDERDDQRQMAALALGRHELRPRREPLHDERAEQHGAAQAARHAERQRRHERAAERGVVRGRRRDHAFHRSAAEWMLASRPSRRIGVCHPLRHAGADARQHADGRADRRAAQHEAPMRDDVACAVHEAATAGDCR